MSNCLFTTGSLVLTAAMLACGMAFFSPYWLENLKASEPAVTNATYLLSGAGLPWAGNYSRGLWAQCGAQCQWFWEGGFTLQVNLFTPLKWHLATQVLYTIGAVLVLVCEIFSRVQLCCNESRRVYRAITALLFISLVTQTAALAVFGSYASKAYDARCNPLQNFAWEWTDAIYFHWSYWMAVAGAGLTLVGVVIFSVLGCCCTDRMEK